MSSVKKYLVYVETGGEQGNYICSNMYYTIIEGSMGVSIVEDWCKTNNIKYNKIKYDIDENCWRVDGYIVRVIELIEDFDETWKHLEWR